MGKSAPKNSGASPRLVIATKTPASFLCAIQDSNLGHRHYPARLRRNFLYRLTHIQGIDILTLDFQNTCEFKAGGSVTRSPPDFA